MSDDNPRNAQGKSGAGQNDPNPANHIEPLIVTIEPQTKNKYSYEAKSYRLERARYRLEKKAYRTAHWTMVFLLIYTGFTLIIVVSSIFATYHAGRSADYQVAANRAWIVPEPPPQNKRVIQEANLEWHNVGKTPALAVFSGKEYFIGELPRHLRTCAEIEREVKRQPVSTWQYQAFVAEGGRYEIGLDNTPAWTGAAPLNIHGCIWYTDILSKMQRSTEFFYEAFQNKYIAYPPEARGEGVTLYYLGDRPFVYE